MVKKKVKKVKSKGEPPIQAFDLESSHKNELIKYIALLEKELALMKKDCIFYSSSKEKMMVFLEIMRKASLSQRNDLVVKNSTADQLVEQLRRLPEKYNEKKLFNERENVRKKQEKVFHNFVERSTAEADHFDEEQFLKKQIADKNKRLEFDQFHCQMSMMDMKEAYQNSMEVIDRKFSKQLGNVLCQNVNYSLEAMQDFTSDKLRTLITVWDVQDNKRETCISQIKHMQDFFHQISTNNHQVMKVLQEKLTGLQVENRKISLNLKQVMQQNTSLKNLEPIESSPISSVKASVRVHQTIMNLQNDKKLEKLKFRNDVLLSILDMAKANLKNMKRQFTNTTRKIYREADFKAHVLEELIRMNLLMENQEEEVLEECDLVRPGKLRKERKSGTVEDMVNMFTLRVESADTLFVPPIYQEFWSSNE